MPIEYREETDEELIKRLRESYLKHLESNPDIDNFAQDFGVCRLLLPLKNDEKVILSTFTGEIEMSGTIEQAGLA